jgi:hypothetical protein
MKRILRLLIVKRRIPMKSVPSVAETTAALLVLLLVGGPATAQETVKAKTSSVSQQTAAPSQQEPTEPTGSGMILVAKRPIKLLASPSSSAVTLYGFPAGRRFRLIAQKPGFAQIQDLKSGATGWIDEASLGQSPQVPVASVPSEPKSKMRPHKEVAAYIPSKAKPVSRPHTKTVAVVPAKPTRTHMTATAETKSEAPKQPKRHGLFGLRHDAQGVLY